MPASIDPLSALAGFGFGLSLIVAIGAQNAFVLRQGLLRRHVFAVVAVCALSDAVLIGVGISGVGLAIDRLPVLMTIVRIGGAAFLVVYGVLAARRALRPSALAPDTTRLTAGLAATVATCLALTWLNPHVYLDTIVLLGSVANSHGDSRWLFGIGAAIASVVWFTALGYGARLLRPVFARPLAWRILDGVIALVMFAIALSLILGI
ncbi:LysE/ArgO family amino acid transporter [Herbiconiux sp. UC225_62]|uniref:LysE/ArgO family amino acid transporter n=1 Tax=Herbiconiux sp. UC225_62 TaxID=3350168 RepID=UPI0036D3C2BF